MGWLFRAWDLFSLQNKKVINNGLVSEVARIRLLTKTSVYFMEISSFMMERSLSVISLLLGGCLFTMKYSTVWRGAERDSELLLMVDCVIQQYLLFLSLGSSAGSLPRGGVLPSSH